MRQNPFYASSITEAIIYIVMKIAVWLSAVNAESAYVRREPLKTRTLCGQPHEDVDEEKEEYEIVQIIEDAHEYYVIERGYQSHADRENPEWCRLFN